MKDSSAQVETASPATARMGHIQGSRFGSPRKAIRRMCMACCNNSRAEVRLCHVPGCALWPFRFGNQPEKAEAAGEIVDPARFDEVVAQAEAADGR